MGNYLLVSKAQPENNFCYEQSLKAQGFTSIAGSDEAGRGPLAGPVVAASVILPAQCNPAVFLDSKKLSHSKLASLYQLLHDIDAAIGIGIVSAEKIDQINILQASLLAMRLSVEDLTSQNYAPDFVLVDGKFEIPFALPQQALIKGESKSASIAAASIIAKVTRDNLMIELDRKYPVYNFKKHKGYPTKAHRQAIIEHGSCEIHRKSFKGVKDVVHSSI
jgi:ribonuclease HII